MTQHIAFLVILEKPPEQQERAIEHLRHFIEKKLRVILHDNTTEVRFIDAGFDAALIGLGAIRTLNKENDR